MRLEHRLGRDALERLNAPKGRNRRKDDATPITKLKPKKPNHRTAKERKICSTARKITILIAAIYRTRRSLL